MDDSELFRAYTEDVKPIKHDKVSFRAKPKIKPSAEQLNPEFNDNLNDNFSEIAAEEVLFFARPGLQTKLLRKLKRGQLDIEARLDLHGLILPEAKQSLVLFLDTCLAKQMRHVLIVHGKGTGKLKSAVNGWLMQYDEVLAFCSAASKDGGTGAVYILFKRQRET